ncbi:DivIVA domain-containing protein [Arthrobacter pascens]|uniref:DivIVA domain-containing protein n=1 Tax=Arthrobacter pascens TaxID=1677 RepID=UPI00285D3E68|nr:DivIVA domain-containing protein [Arthrobacter pascens]MDR6556137.1 DivIVA domain-containing protein [Arthrobacter pascens]
MGDVSFFLVFLAIVLIGVTAVIGTDLGARIFRRNRPGSTVFDDGFDEPVASLPPVLLPAEAKPADVDHVRFALGLRGYRMDQVDQVLDDLRDQLASKDAEIAGLRAHLRGQAPGGAATDDAVKHGSVKDGSVKDGAVTQEPAVPERSRVAEEQP